MALTLPVAAVNTTNVDNGADRPDLARPDILDVINKLNSLLANLSTGTGAGTLAVRDGSGKLAGDVLGNAATATSAAACSGNSATATSATSATTATNSAGTGTVPKTVENGQRVIRGEADYTGALVVGSGYTVAKSSTGVYVVTFSTAFSAKPIAVVSSTFINPTMVCAGATTTQITVKTYNSSGTATDSGFTFIAVGPN